MTWGEFKKAVEDRNVGDFDDLDYIDWLDGLTVNVTIVIEDNERHVSITD